MTVCPVCRTENPGGSRFCSSCGSALGTPQGRTERKFATALFADIVGSTALAEKNDPEIVAELVGEALDRMVERVERHGGVVASRMGDGILALFGTPKAHEDDCERAVRAALEIHAAISELNRQPRLEHRPDLDIHIGIEAGEMLVFTPREGGYTLTGDAVNTASRLQGVAGPGEVIVGLNVHLATCEAIEYSELERLRLKGKSQPVRAWSALRIKARSGAQKPKTQLSAPLIGRDEELEILEQALARTESEGRPVLVSVLGPAGVGKSRLSWELLDHIEALPQTFYWRSGRCLPYGGAPYGAMGDAIRSHCEILEDDPLEVAVGKVTRAVEDLFGDQELLPEMLALTGTSGDTDFSRERLFDAWRRFLERMAARYPLVLVLEDLHWADDGLLDFLDHLSDWASGPLFLLTLARPELLERRPGWGGGKRNYTSLYLDPLTTDECAEMLRSMLGTQPPNNIVQRIIERSEGNPLFAEEIVRHLIDNRVFERSTEGWTVPDPAREVQIPRSIHSLIAARIDSLSADEKAFLQDASVVGRGFWIGAVQRLRSRPVDPKPLLDGLRLKELIIKREPSTLSGEDEFAFRHALIRDVAYESLPKTLRADKHAQVARWAEERSSDGREQHAAVIAFHYSQALGHLTALDDRRAERSGYASQTYRWSLIAARRAAHLWQHRQAVRWYREAIALVDEVGASEEERAELLDLYASSTLGTETYEETASAHEAALRAYEELDRPHDAGRIEARLAQIAFESSRGDLVPRVESAIQRLDSLGDSEALASALHVLGWYHWRRGHYDEAEPPLRRSAEMAERVDAPVVRGQALTSLAVLLVDRNDWREGLELLEKSYLIAQDAGNIDLLLRVAHNLANVIAHFAPGDDPDRATTGIDRARAILDDGLEIARRAGNRRWESGILAMTAWVLKNSGELNKAERYAVEALESARAIGRSSSLIGEQALVVSLIRIDMGDIAGAETLFDEGRAILQHPSEPGNDVWIALAGAPILMARGDIDGAVRLLTDTLDSVGTAVSVYGGEWLIHHAVRSLLRAGSSREAARLMEEKKRLLVGGPITEAVIAWTGSLLIEDPGERHRALSETAERFGALNWRVEQGRCLLDAAMALGETEGRGKEERAEALAILDGCGAAVPVWLAKA